MSSIRVLRADGEEIIELRELVYSVFFMAFIFFLRQRYWH